MLVHVFDDTPHHYIPMRNFFSLQCKINSKQEFWVRKPLDALKVDPTIANNVLMYSGNEELLLKLSTLPETTQVLFHGLFDINIWRKLIFMPVVTRSSCVFWGAELYRHGKKSRTLKQYIAQFIHQYLVFRFKNVLALNPGDANLIQQYLKRKNATVLPYPLIGLSAKTLADNRKSTSDEVSQNNPVKILLGNSAAPSNEHCMALKKLAHLAQENIQIIVPLNYAGQQNYIAEVINYGKELFADKFTPITQMLEKSAYDKLLVSVDITVFAHQRQQGLYVVYAMLLQGKPMFLCSSTSSFSNLSSLGFRVYPSEKLADYSYKSLCELLENTDNKNQQLMEQHFTENALAPKWSSFLNGLFKS